MLFVGSIERVARKNRHHFSNEALAILFSAHIVPQGSPLLDVFHSATHYLHASGIFVRFMNDYMDATPLIPLPNQRLEMKGLEPIQLFMLFLLWTGGIILGILAFLVEISVCSKGARSR